MKKKSKIIIIMSVFIIMICSVFCVSLMNFGSINIPKIASAIINVNNDKSNYVVVKEKSANNKKENLFSIPKKSIIATPNKDFTITDYANENGYKIIDQMGSQFTLSKDGEIEEAYCPSANQYFALWTFY